MSADDERAAGDVPPVRGQTLLRGRALTRDELRALLRACAADSSPAGRRDAALLALGYAGGLRRAEIVALDLADYDAPTGRVTVRHGKGNKARTVYVAGDWARLIDAWVRARGGQAGPLLQAISKAGRVLQRRLAPAAVRWLLLRRVDQAQIAACSPHDLRRSCISDLLDAGVDIATAQRIAGHASVTTTARYDRRGEAAKQRAALKLALDG
jgi:integrase